MNTSPKLLIYFYALAITFVATNLILTTSALIFCFSNYLFKATFKVSPLLFSPNHTNLIVINKKLSFYCSCASSYPRLFFCICRSCPVCPLPRLEGFNFYFSVHLRPVPSIALLWAYVPALICFTKCLYFVVLLSSN